MYHVLVCDDDRDIVRALDVYLRAEGYATHLAYNGREALELVKNNTVHLALMDIMMPGLDGLSATVKLREESNIPVILLTAKSEDGDKVLGLTLGADDYVTKPFSPVEVLARVKSQLRRYTALGGMAAQGNRLTIGGLSLDDAGKTVTLDGEAVSLTPTEYAILKLLMEKPGRVFSSAEIYASIWKGSAVGAENTVAVHIRHLREKLEIVPSEPRYIKVVWGHGYKMEGK
ncbi:MAG: response regulator transcription factor [Clostridiaceae bacterium]|nr:response regulator transcription factor [Eubacteriales bacterium]